MPPVFDWKQVDLSDFVFSLKLKLKTPSVTHQEYQQHSQPHRSSFSMAARQSFDLLLMQNQNVLNNRRSSFAEIDKRTELDCENRSLYTQVQLESPLKIMWFMSRTGCYIITGSRLNHATFHCLAMPSLSVKVELFVSSSSCWRGHFHHIVHF